MRKPGTSRMPGSTLGINVPRLLRAVEQGVLPEDLVERFGLSQRTLTSIIAYHRRQTAPARRTAT